MRMTILVSRMKKRRHIIGGYVWNAAMDRAQAANERTHEALADLHEHLTTTPEYEINVLLLSQLLTDACLAVADSAAALNELKGIADAQLSKG